MFSQVVEQTIEVGTQTAANLKGQVIYLRLTFLQKSPTHLSLYEFSMYKLLALVLAFLKKIFC